MPPPPSTTPSIKVVKTFPFKGGSVRWSNRYHFDNGSPADQTKWHTLMDNITAVEKACLQGDARIVEALGYDAGSEVPVASKTYALVPTLGGTGSGIPGECAALVRYGTAARSVKNHPIYLFNYYHACLRSTAAGSFDKLDPTQQAALLSFANGWIAGLTDGTIVHHRTSPQGHLATGAIVEEWITHRDFPYTTSV